GAVVQRADVQASNGVIHVIDTVLLPTTRSLKVALDSTGRFTTFLELCERAGVDELLEGGDELTIFAPTDEAFEQVPAKTLRQLRSERKRAELRRLLERHIVAGRISALEATAGAPPRTLAGSDVRCAIRGSSAPRPFGAVEIIAPDLDAVNGCVHVISEVLTPPSGFTLAPTGRLILGVFLDSAGPVLASQFALGGKRALVVQRLTPGGPAQQVGVQPNDVIVAINGETATSSVLDRAKHAAGYGG